LSCILLISCRPNLYCAYYFTAFIV